MSEDRPVAREPGRQPRDESKERLATHAAPAAAGAVGGATAGAIAGIALGPLGSAVGAAAGALAGAAAGASTGKGGQRDPRIYEAFWREHFRGRPYAAGADYERYGPAYRYAIEEYLQTDHPQTWEEVRHRLCLGWRAARGDCSLSWDEAMPAVRDAWQEMLYPGQDVR